MVFPAHNQAVPVLFAQPQYFWNSAQECSVEQLLFCIGWLMRCMCQLYTCYVWRLYLQYGLLVLPGIVAQLLQPFLSTGQSLSTVLSLCELCSCPIVDVLWPQRYNFIWV